MSIIDRKPKADDVVLKDGQRVPNPYALMELAMMKMMFDAPEDLLEFCYPMMEDAAARAGKHSDEYMAKLYGVKEVTPRRSQLIRERCRTIAAILWAQNPKLRIKDVVEHGWIQTHGEAGTYDYRTIHGWVADLDPRPPEEKKTPFKAKESA